MIDSIIIESIVSVKLNLHVPSFRWNILEIVHAAKLLVGAKESIQIGKALLISEGKVLHALQMLVE